MMVRKKPWPIDAVIVVAARPEDALRDRMESVNPCVCRDCGTALVADGKTIRAAEALPERRGRPIDFFCIPCAVQYNVASITHFVDHRQAPA